MFVIIKHCNFLSLSLEKKHLQIYDNFILMMLRYKDAMIWDRTIEILQALNTKQGKQRARNDQVIFKNK